MVVSLFEVRTSVPLRQRFFWFGLFLLPVVFQLWVPPYLGLADNGDFAKVMGRYALTPLNPGPQPTFHFFNRLWQFDPQAEWLSPYWGVEVWLAKLALWLGGTTPFDMRWMGLVHVCIWSAAVWLMVGRQLAPNLFAWIAFTDAAYVTYFQSFYFDAATIVFLLLLIAAWRADSSWFLGLGAVGFALAKAPHAPLAIALGLILLLERKRRYWPACAALIVGGGFMLSQTKPEYKATAYYNLAFFKLGLIDKASLSALEIRPEDERLVGTHAFMPDSPAQDAAWLAEFYPQGGYGNALLYYLKNPAVVAEVMWKDLTTEAPQIRAVNLGNYERSTGMRYCTLSKAFGWYSELKSWLFRVAPWHVFVLVLVALWRCWRQPVFWGVLAIGGYTFGVATLADACETYRHLLLFHLACDLLIWLAVAETQSKQASSLSWVFGVKRGTK